MAAGTFQPIRPWDVEGFRAGQLPTVYIQEAASLNVQDGTPVAYDSARQLAACAASFKQAAFITQDDSANAASAGTILPAWAVTTEMIWSISLNEAWALNLQGNSYGLVKDATTGYWYVSTADTGNQVRIVGAPPTTAIGDTKSTVLIRFNREAVQASANSLLPGVGTALASTTTVAPTNLVHHVTGTNAIATITIPAGFPDGGLLTLIPDAAFTFTTAGNIAKTATGVASQSMYVTFDRTTNKLYPSY